MGNFLPPSIWQGPLDEVLDTQQMISAPLCLPPPLLQGPLGDVLDTQQMISDVSGAGNNWAHGNHMYGPQVRRGVITGTGLSNYLHLISLH